MQLINFTLIIGDEHFYDARTIPVLAKHYHVIYSSILSVCCIFQFSTSYMQMAQVT